MAVIHSVLAVVVVCCKHALYLSPPRQVALIPPPTPPYILLSARRFTAQVDTPLNILQTSIYTFTTAMAIADLH